MKWFVNKRLLLFLSGLIVFVALMGLTLGQLWPATFPEKVVKDTIAWTQGMIYRPAAAVSGFIRDIRSIFVVYEENKALRETLFHYVRDTQRLNDLERENRELKEALRFTEEQKRLNNYKWRIAQVVSVSPDPMNHVIVINLGSNDGIKENMAVVTSGGLVGRIVYVTPFHANVQLLTELDGQTSDSKAVSVRIKGKEDNTFGLIDHYDPTTGLLTMSKIEPNALVEKGDIVVTSGIGEVFPAGIEVGEVVASEESSMGITKSAKVKPKASFRQIRQVFVVEVPEAGVNP